MNRFIFFLAGLVQAAPCFAQAPGVGSVFHGYAILKTEASQPLGELELRVGAKKLEIVYPSVRGGEAVQSFVFAKETLTAMTAEQVRKALEEDDDSYAGQFEGYFVGDQKCPCLILRKSPAQGTDYTLMAIFDQRLADLDSPLPTASGSAFALLGPGQKRRGDLEAYLEELKALVGQSEVRNLPRPSAPETTRP